MSAIELVHKLIHEQHVCGQLFSQLSPFDSELVVNTAFHDNGHVKFRFTVKDGRLHGPGKIYYDNAQLKEEMPFHKGILHGANRGWYDNGQIQWETNYVNNQIQGIRREWYRSSRLMSECRYQDNQPEGSFTQWHHNGQIKERGGYWQGKRHGIFKEYNEAGQLVHKELFVRGIRYTGKVDRWLNSSHLDCRRLSSIKSEAVRRFLLEELGYARIARELVGERLDQDGTQELLRIVWHKDEEPLYLVKVKCPSTYVFYTLRVAPHVTTIKEAIAWTFGLPQEEYCPQEES